MHNSIKKIINFKDPLKKNLSSWKRPNGLTIKKVSIPIGVSGVIYESRPNVTSDVAALCLKTGNVVILRGGSEAFHSNKILVKLRFVTFKPFPIFLLSRNKHTRTITHLG